MVFISSPYSNYDELNEKVVQVPVDLIEVRLDCNIFEMELMGKKNDERKIMQHHFFKHGRHMNPHVRDSLEEGTDYIYTERFRDLVY